MSHKHYRVCNLCEAMCGLEIEHDGHKILRIKGDKKDPFSKGSICPKGANYGALHEDPHRIKHPLRRTDEGWEEISYKEAFDEIEKNIKRIRSKYGNNSIALYLGNPTVHNFGFMMFVGAFKRALATKNSYSPTSMDQLPHHFAAHFMFGHSMLVPIPDIDRTDYMIIMGANPAISNGSLMSSAGVQQRLKKIKDRGGKYIVIDPRKNETAISASEHHFIKPGSDVYFLWGMLHVIFDQGRVRLGHLHDSITELDKIEEIARIFEPEKVAQLTGIDTREILRITSEYVKADRAVLYGRMGLSTQEHGGICHWLINTINLCTGHFDKEGGAMFTLPAVDIVKRKKQRNTNGRWFSRVRKLPEFDGELPVSTMAEDMLEPGDGQIKALITNAGNPVLSAPNSSETERALKGLDFMFSMDIYINETTRHAHIILPPPSGLEIDHYDIIFNALAVSNNAKFSKALFKPKKGTLYDWQILKELTKRISEKRIPLLHRLGTPKMLLKLALVFGPYGNLSSLTRLFSGLNLGKIKRSKHGIHLGPLQPRLPEALITPNKKINLAHDLFLKAVEKLVAEFEFGAGLPSSGKFMLIGRRSLKSNNSWMHNVEKLVAGKNMATALINTLDAQNLGIMSEEIVGIKTDIGEIKIQAELSDKIMPGVISIPHGFGHDGVNTKIPVAEAHAGVNLNSITDTNRIDGLTSNAAFSGQLAELLTLKK